MASRRARQVADRSTPIRPGVESLRAPSALPQGHSVSSEPSPTKSGPVGAEAGDHRTPSDQAPITLWLRRADQFFLGFLVIALLGLLVIFRWRLSAGGQAEIEIINQQPREFFYSIDINQASWVEWAQLDGIGEKLARRIVGDRTQNGPFKSIDDVARVRGLGIKLIDKLRPFLKHDTASEEVRELR